MDVDSTTTSVPVQVTGREGSGAADVRPDVGREVESVKEATMPTQEAPAAEDSSLELSEFENIKERPVQETATAKKIFSDPSVKGDESLSSGKEARQPTQETPEAEKSLELSEFENIKERPVQESADPKKSTSDSSDAGNESLSSGKEARRPTQEASEAEKPSLSLSEFENIKERPVQESADPKKSTSDSPDAGDEALSSGKEARRPTQETPDAEKPSLRLSEEENFKETPVKESVDDEPVKETPVQESEEPTEKEGELKGHPVRHVYQEGDFKEFMKDTPLQETEDQSSKEPKTEDQSAEHPVQETKGPGKAQGEEEASRPLKEVEPSEGRPLQESGSCDVERKGSIEEPLPTQETMAAGKGPFEETGIEVGVKGQPTDEKE